MTIFQRIKNVLFGILVLAAGVVFLLDPSDEAYMIIIAFLTLGLAIRGISDIFFYFTMARHMVGGKVILYKGVVILDFAFLTGTLSNVPKIYILLYLIAIHAFAGAIDVLRAMEARSKVEGPWKLKCFQGVGNILLAVACLVFIRYTNTALIIYSIGLIYSAILRIISAFRPTAFIVIK